MGLAPDGGLFIPESIPQVDLAELERLAAKSYADMASYLADLFFGDEISHELMYGMVMHAYDFDCPLRKMTDKIWNLELFHGPTFAFKDFGARFMGGMMGLLNSGGDALTVLTATSGDTGSAVAAGFYGVEGVDVVILYPEGKVSDLQESQMTTLGGNVHPVRVRGNFDDCQALVKAVFNDREFRAGYNVTSANSINLLRWVPQSFYYFYAWAQWHREHDEAPDIVVPSGNYGNITAGMLAMRMGMPVRRWITASNANDVVPEYLRTGEYKPRASVQTLANAMDVGAPSNFERMMYLYDNDFEKLSSNLEGFGYSDESIRSTIRDIENRCDGYISDPHSATGYAAAVDGKATGFYLSTAHPAKFVSVIESALGHGVEIPCKLAEAMSRQKSFKSMDASLDDLEAYLQVIRCR